MVYNFPRSAMNGWLSQFWRLKVRNQGVVRVDSFFGLEGRSCFPPLSWLLVAAAIPGLADGALPVSSIALPLCMSVCVLVPPLWNDIHCIGLAPVLMNSF